MAGHVYKPNCICKDKKKCTCNATWAYIVDLGRKNPKTGRKWPYKKGGFRLKKEAEDAMAQLIVDVRGGTFIKESALAFGEFSSQWKEHYAITNNPKGNTLRMRQKEINVLNRYFEFIPLKDIKKKDYQQALAKMKKSGRKNGKGYSENSIIGINATAKMIFNLATEWSYIKKENNPTEGAKVPRDKLTVAQIENAEDLPEYMERDELLHFLDTAKDFGLPDDYEIFTTLSYTGLRVGELSALKDTDLKVSDGLIRITKSISHPKNFKEYEIDTPKTKKSIRDVTIDADLIDMLTKLIAKRKVIKMQFRQTYYDKGYIFCYPDDKHKRAVGYPYPAVFYERRMTRLLKKAGLNETLTPHSLRHTHISLLAEAGAGLQEIMDRVGHENDKTTQRIYLHVTKEKKTATAQLFSQHMKRA